MGIWKEKFKSLQRLSCAIIDLKQILCSVQSLMIVEYFRFSNILPKTSADYKISSCIRNNLLCSNSAHTRQRNDSYHSLHLSGTAGTVPHKSRIIHFLVCHLRFMAILVVEIMALLTLHQLIPRNNCHLPAEKIVKNRLLEKTLKGLSNCCKCCKA